MVDTTFFKRATDLARALQVTQARRAGAAGGTTVKSLLEKKKLRDGSFDSLFPALISIDGGDIAELIQKSRNANLITQAEAICVERAYIETIDYLVKTLPRMDQLSFLRLQNKIDDFVSYFNDISSDPTNQISSDVFAQLDLRLNSIVSTFKEQNYLIAATPGFIGSVIILSKGYKPGTSLGEGSVNSILKSKLAAIVKEYNTSLEKDLAKGLVPEEKLIKNLQNPEYLTKTLANWGHGITEVYSSAEGEEGVINPNILTGKLLASLLSVGKGITEEIAQQLNTNFVQSTGQINSKINLIQTTAEGTDPGVLSLVISSGYFQSVRVQFGKENVGALSVQERAWSIEQVLKNNSYLVIELGNAMGIPNASIRKIVDNLVKISSSPTYLQKTAALVFSPLTDKKVTFSPTNTELLNSKRKISKIFGKAKANTLKKASSGGTKLKPPVVVKVLTNLPMLMMQINSNLHDQIKRNMGTGSRKDVLNYRTGRFAQSAKVEKLSESRQGMITAFYSYMKNPYATFSRGGRQERPYTRDPKLLISKSIRELAGQQVANRMRAVSV